MGEYDNLTDIELLNAWNTFFSLNHDNPKPYYEFKMKKLTDEEHRRYKNET